MANVSTLIPAIVIPLFFVFIFAIILFKKGIKFIKEREVMVIERFGKFRNILHAGVHFIIPFVDRPKTFYYSYYLDNPITGYKELKEAYNLTRISTQNEVIDLPKQSIITRDNALLLLDAVISYKIVNPKQMIYSCNNLPNILSKLLQAQLRNITGSLEIDQIIEEAASLNVLTGLMGNEAQKWGVEIIFVKVQKVEALSLTDVLAKKKNADLKNKEIIINAKNHKQTKVIDAEAKRDYMVKKAEGEAQEIISKAKGKAQAIINVAVAEVRNIKEIARAVGLDTKKTIDASKYILTMKYLEGMKEIFGLAGTSVKLLNPETAELQNLNLFGVTSVLPPTTKFLKTD
ncbi:hypothetical protein DLAC_01140 [Tieghemostelium lacteum]|uniref:Band 7 domain-containing protein n=1 Tax=Tieghemostelium lacteum TaxID=361077 RepID=A0A152A7X8_TIELA|nr:hypothetical protein DLAC_01140 [Tieghemostelium lacteum]|eukprot:KYR02308.1 hypothetical protein DLAC_01140 [Tieghemostelium lacteum]